MQQLSAEWLRQSFIRGRVQVQFKYSSGEESSSILALDHNQLDQALQSLHYASSQNIPFEANAALLLDLTKILQDNKSPTAWEDLEPTVEKAFRSALDDINSMRCREEYSQ